MTFKALTLAIAYEATFQEVLNEAEGLSISMSRLALLLQDRGLETARSLFAALMQFDIESRRSVELIPIKREIEEAEGAGRLAHFEAASILRSKRKLN